MPKRNEPNGLKRNVIIAGIIVAVITVLLTFGLNSFSKAWDQKVNKDVDRVEKQGLSDKITANKEVLDRMETEQRKQGKVVYAIGKELKVNP